MEAMRAVRVVAIVVALAAGAAACSEDSTSSLPRPSKAFCQAAYDYDANLPKLANHLDQQIVLIRKMAANAPADIRADAQAFLDAWIQTKAGHRSVLRDPKVKKAVENVERRANDGCGLFKQDPPSGM